MTGRRHTRSAFQARKRPSQDEIERRYRQVLRMFAQTASACAVIGGALLLTGNQTLHSMGLFLLAWAAGWVAASVYLLVRRTLKSVHKPRKR